ncbi:hypothetical protein FG379_003355 [Cryptosporidium bovis]|uniref:uncharacterized protein n=1 Tax=Cryptosporidium bovis TaxID=310047 RepID=UPI003519F620|nr:hypothetical protein FG379_003355 [Cryptosporidium bovis]
MEEGYDWDKIRSFQIVDGIGIDTTSLLNDDILVPPRDTSSKSNLNQKEDLSRKLSSISQLLMYPNVTNNSNINNSTNINNNSHSNSVNTPREGLENVNSKTGFEKQYVNNTAGGFGFGIPFVSTSLPNSMSSSRSGSASVSRSGSVSDIQQHYVMHPGLIDAPTAISLRDANGTGGLDGIEAINNNISSSNLNKEVNNRNNIGSIGGNNNGADNMSNNIYGFHSGISGHFQHSDVQYQENDVLNTEKDIQKQLYSDRTGVVGAGVGSMRGGDVNNKVSCNQNSVGVKSSSKTRNRRVKENSEDFSANNCSKNYSQRDGNSGCQIGSGSLPNLSEDLNSIKYYEGFKLPLGDLGRKMLLKKLREIHTQNPTKMEKALTDHGLSYTRIRFASVQQLFKISYVCDVFDYALSIHCEFGRPRHRDSSKGANGNNANGGVQISSSVASSPSSRNSPDSKRSIDSSSHNSGFVTGSNLMCIESQNIIDENYMNTSNQKNLDLELDSCTPETSPCGSHRSGSSTSSVSTTASANSISGSNCGLITPDSKDRSTNKMDNDLSSPMSIFSTNCSPPNSQKKRKTSVKSSSPSVSSYNFSPPPIPVTGSRVDIHNQLVLGDINGNHGVNGGSLSVAGSGSVSGSLINETIGSSDTNNGYLIPGPEGSSGTNQNGYINFDRNNNNMVLGYGAVANSNNGSSNISFLQKPGNLMNGNSTDGTNNTCSQPQSKFKSTKSCYLSNDENEGIDSIIRNSVNNGDNHTQKSNKRQKTRSKKRGNNIGSASVNTKELNANLNNDICENISVSQTTPLPSHSSLNGTFIGNNGVNSNIPVINGGMGLTGFCGLSGHTQIYGSSERDYEELYPTSSEITPFYQPEPEISFINGFTVSETGNNLSFYSFENDSAPYETSLLINAIIESEGNGTNNNNNSHHHNHNNNNSNSHSNSNESINSNDININNTNISNINDGNSNTNNNIGNTTSSTNNGLFTAEVVGNSVCDNPFSTSLYYYTDPFNTSTFDDYYLESTNYNGLPYQGVNSIDFYSSTDFDIDNVDVAGCPVIST